MKSLWVVALCLIASSASAQQFEFRGDFVKTYSVDKEPFLKTIPEGTELQCSHSQTCASRRIRIYVFKNKQLTKWFWTAKYYNVQYDEPEYITALGKDGHVIYYDETNQVIYRSHESIEADMRRSKEIEKARIYTDEEIHENMERLDNARAREIKDQEHELSKTYNK
jgi:hypothetical protein